MKYQFHISMVDRPKAEHNSLPHKKAPRLILSPAASKFAAAAGDDLLFEIFLRLSDRRSAIRCSAVCRRWLSLIISAPQIATSLVRRRHRQSFESSPRYGLFLAYRNLPFYDPSHTASRQTMLSEPNAYLKFLLGTYDVKASSDDLLLLARSPTASMPSPKLCVCNPLTRELIELPLEPPIRYVYMPHGISNYIQKMYGLACKYKYNCSSNNNSVFNGHYGYKVVLIVGFLPDIETVIFCSVTREWTQSTFRISPMVFRRGYFTGETIVANDGILYTEFTVPSAKGLVAMDLFNDDVADPARCRFIKICDHHLRGEDGKERRLGVVRGRLRLSQLTRLPNFYRPSSFVVRILELNSASFSWDLVEEFRLSMNNKQKELISVLAFDPNASDAVFLLRSRTIYRYRIREKKFEKIWEISFRRKECENFFFNHVVRAFTVVQYPSWPTPIHTTLPSTATS